jgi:hypothetical protein
VQLLIDFDFWSFEGLLRMGLWSTKEVFIGFLLSFIWYFYDRSVAQRCLSILFFSIVLNQFLKNCFQFPLNPQIGTHTWAFPSGHMTTALVTFCWICHEIRKNWIFFFSGVLLAIIACGLWYFGYHDIIDILGSIFFGTLTLIGFQFLLIRFPTLLQINFLLIFLMFLMCFLLPFIPMSKSLNYEWIVLSAMLGMTLGLTLNHSNVLMMNNRQKSLAFFLFIIGTISIHYGVIFFPPTQFILPINGIIKGVFFMFYVNVPIYIISKNLNVSKRRVI